MIFASADSPLLLSNTNKNKNNSNSNTSSSTNGNGNETTTMDHNNTMNNYQHATNNNHTLNSKKRTYSSPEKKKSSNNSKELLPTPTVVVTATTPLYNKKKSSFNTTNNNYANSLIENHSKTKSFTHTKDKSKEENHISIDNDNASALIYGAVYSGVPVFEMMCKNVAVMRRRDDCYLNATQILKVAGIDKGRRTKILEREILTGTHEKVQGGYGKYQGTWIPFQRGVELAKQYKVDQFLKPLLDFEISPLDTPSKEDVIAAQKRQAALNAAAANGGILPPSSLSHHQSRATTPSTNHKNNSSIQGSASTTTNTNTSSKRQSNRKSAPLAPPPAALPSAITSSILSHHQNPISTPTTSLASSANLDNIHHRHQQNPPPREPEFHIPPDHPYHQEHSHMHKRIRLHGELDDPTFPHHHHHNSNGNHHHHISPSASGTPNHNQIMFPQLSFHEPITPEANKSILMSIFMSDDPHFIPDALIFAGLGELNLDMIIDEQGNTATHWAAALARVETLRFLLAKGANATAQNHAGETPLIRAVQVTNNYDNQCFQDLLDLLFSTSLVTDKKHQNFLHHVAVSSGLQNRGQASRYYLECILEKITLVDSGDFGKYVDVQDVNGDTPLLIAGRVGHQNIVDQLVDIGANPLLTNRAGLKLADFGYEYLGLKPTSPDLNEPINVSPLLTLPNIQTQVEKVIQSLDKASGHVLLKEDGNISQAIQKMIDDMNLTYTNDIQRKLEDIRDAKRQLREITKDMVNLRKQNQILRQENQQLPELFHRIQILEKCLRDELVRKENESILYEQHYNMQQQQQQQGSSNVLGHNNRLPSRYNQTHSQHPESSMEELQEEVTHLRARLAAKERIEQDLREELLNLKSSRSTVEQQCKRIIAQCCNIPIEGVDTVLSPLLHAVESDDSLADISEVAAFMSRVKQQDLMMKSGNNNATTTSNNNTNGNNTGNNTNKTTTNTISGNNNGINSNSGNISNLGLHHSNNSNHVSPSLSHRQQQQLGKGQQLPTSSHGHSLNSNNNNTHHVHFENQENNHPHC